jgi:NAD(P)-dependent dehydrogenase (short-subunit alcohol dehydrogenase family)
MESLAPEVAPFGIHTTIVNPGMFRTELLTEASATYATPSITDYAERGAAQQRGYEVQNGRQAGDPAKLALALLTIADQQPPPRRFIAGADAVAVVMLCMAVARRWLDVYANAVDPGWVPTRMGGRGAPDDLHQGYETQTWLATSNERSATVSGRYFHHLTERRSNPQASDVMLQERLLSLCRDITGVSFPR